MSYIRAFLEVVEDDHLVLLGQRVGGHPQELALSPRASKMRRFFFPKQKQTRVHTLKYVSDWGYSYTPPGESGCFRERDRRRRIAKLQLPLFQHLFHSGGIFHTIDGPNTVVICEEASTVEITVP